MNHRILLALTLLLSWPLAALAAPTISAGDHILLPNTPNQVIPILVSGEPSDTFLGVDLYLNVGDGSLGPVITSVDITSPGTVFSGNNNGPADFGPPWQVPGREVVVLTTTQSGFVGPNGVLAFVEFDTTGIAPGVYSLSLSSPTIGPSDLPPFGAPATHLIDGTLTVVPEPSSIVLGLFAASAAALVAVRRRRIRHSN